MDKMIVYEDSAIIVVHKPAGMATETAKIGQADLVSELKNYRKKKGEEPYVGVVHRLDQPVEGLLVFAKDVRTARMLSAGLRNGKLTKKYAALVAGIPREREGILSDYLLKDARTNLSKVVPGGTAGAKEARLRWKVLDRESLDKVLRNEEFLNREFSDLRGCSLLEIELYTGRHHQIRVQMAHAGFPLLGDSKYGSAQSKKISGRLSVHNTALLACGLGLIHPVTGKKMEFSLDIMQLLQFSEKN